MNIIFLTMVRIADVNVSGIYEDLIRKFRDEGHEIYIVNPSERRIGLKTSLTEEKNVHLLNVRTLNVTKTSVIEKGLGQVLLESQYKNAIKKYLSGVKFDLILYSTPPITFPKVIKYLKKENPNAMTYLLLKDIFPQNAVDLGLMSKTGVKSVIYKYFRKKEKNLYALSDYIGCMSPANVRYLLEHNPEITKERVEVAPNSFELCLTDSLDTIEKEAIRTKYGLPVDRPVFIYGGNLGKPQGIPFLIECLEANLNRSDCHFIVIGRGTEFSRLEAWYNKNLNLNTNLNVTLLRRIPRAEYDQVVRSCDVGLIFLDHRFTIPNFPSRMLNYLHNKMPVLFATDPNTDMGRIAEENGYGYWCESNSVEAFSAILDKMIHSDRLAMGQKGYEFFKKNYLVENTYNAIVSHLK